MNLNAKKCIEIEGKKNQNFLVEMKVWKKNQQGEKGLENVRREKKTQFETHT